MARLPALIDDLAAHDPRGRPTVDLIARTIREHGLITTTKRGRGAAEMKAEDAAALLVALCVADTPSTSPTAVREFWHLRRAPDRPELGRLAATAPEILKQLDEASTFGEAISVLIKRGDLIDESLRLTASASALFTHGRPVEQFEAFYFELGVTFLVTEAVGIVHARWAESASLHRSYSAGFRSEGVRVGIEAASDRRVQIGLRWPTFVRLYHLLN